MEELVKEPQSVVKPIRLSGLPHVCVRDNGTGRMYDVVGLFGNVLESRENGVKVGDVRIIFGLKFYAYTVYKHLFEKNEVHWTFVDTIGYGYIREFKRALIGD